MSDIFTRCRKHPENDLISALVTVEKEGNTLSKVELFGICVFFLVVGHHTTTATIPNGLRALLNHQDKLKHLVDDPFLISTAIEEFLRHDSAIQFLSRYATQHFKLGDKQIREGQNVWVILVAANRDPEQFINNDRVNIWRTKNRHLAFRSGIHFCLGTPLARMEGQIALCTLLRRLPGLGLLAITPDHTESINRPLKYLHFEFSTQH